MSESSEIRKFMAQTGIKGDREAMAEAWIDLYDVLGEAWPDWGDDPKVREQPTGKQAVYMAIRILGERARRSLQ